MSRPLSRSAEPLSVVAREAYLKKVKADLERIGKSLSGKFCCAGALTKQEPVQVTIRGKAYTIWPAGDRYDTPSKRLWDQGNDLKDFIGEAKPALFGKGTETLHDPSVRNGWQLAASDFSINIGPEELGAVVEEVQQGLGLGTGIVAELYSLNIYEEGGHFETHKDTPRGGGMFGTLVLCLPSVFMGGNLEVEMEHSPTLTYFGDDLARVAMPHNAISTGHRSWWFWSDREEKEGRKLGIPWCAFFSDADHRVRPVMGGVRVTLTYILRYHDGAPAPEKSPIAQRDEERIGELTGIFCTLASLSHVDVADENYRLGFPCQHLYVNSLLFGEGDASRRLGPSAVQKLRGRDLLIAQAAHEAGLRVYVQPTFNKNDYRRMYLPTFVETRFGRGRHVQDFDADEFGTDSEDEAVRDLFPDSDLAGVKPYDRISCDGEMFRLFETKSEYRGNHGGDKNTYYLQADIIVEVPGNDDSSGLESGDDSSGTGSEREGLGTEKEGLGSDREGRGSGGSARPADDGAEADAAGPDEKRPKVEAAVPPGAGAAEGGGTVLADEAGGGGCAPHSD